MNLKEKHYNLLVVSQSESFNESMRAIFQNFESISVSFSPSVSHAKRKLLERGYDLVMINTPLGDEFGTRFAVDVTTQKNVIAMLVVKSDIYEGVYSKVFDFGVYVLPKPASGQQMMHAISWMCSTRERIRRYEKKTMSLEEKMGEIRIVNHAKWLLIENLKMTESDAHRYIEKRAMDECVSKKEIAEDIINMYE